MAKSSNKDRANYLSSIGIVFTIVATIVGSVFYLGHLIGQKPSIDQISMNVSNMMDSKLKDIQIEQLKALNVLDQKVVKIQQKINEITGKLELPPLELAIMDDSLSSIRSQIATIIIDSLVSHHKSSYLASRSDLARRSENAVEVSAFELIEPRSGNTNVRRNPDSLRVVIMRHNSSIQYCYLRELKINPNLKGELRVRITIAFQGTVKDVEITSSTLKNEGLERCVVSRIRRWDDFGTIEPSFGDTIIRQTYVFGY